MTRTQLCGESSYLNATGVNGLLIFADEIALSDQSSSHLLPLHGGGVFHPPFDFRSVPAGELWVSPFLFLRPAWCYAPSPRAANAPCLTRSRWHARPPPLA